MRKYWLAVLLGVNFAIAGLIFALPPAFDQSPGPQMTERMRIAFALLGILSFGAERYYQAISIFPSEKLLPQFSVYLFNQAYSQFSFVVLLILSGGVVCGLIWV